MYRSGKGRPIVGVDLGGGRAWSSAVAYYPNGRVEALAVAPGVPDVARPGKAGPCAKWPIPKAD